MSPANASAQTLSSGDATQSKVKALELNSSGQSGAAQSCDKNDDGEPPGTKGQLAPRILNSDSVVSSPAPGNSDVPAQPASAEPGANGLSGVAKKPLRLREWSVASP